MEYKREFKLTKPYTKGEDIKDAQQILKKKGFDPGEIDGVYGPKSANAMIAFKLTLVNEVCDKATWDALHKLDVKTPGEMLAEYALSKVGCLYVSGAQGQDMTLALIRRLEQDDSNYKRALAAYNKHVKEGLTVEAYDCSGLIIKYLLDNKLIKQDYNANGIYYTLCDSIEKNELQAGDLVFKKYLTSSRIYHVGVYMGDGTVVHSKGRDYGVIREDVSKAGWNRYGRLKVLR